MKICKLCKEKEANQTGSHLTSCFIVASQIGKRDEEKGYDLTADPNQDYSQNKKAESIKEDYILCLGCEKRLSYIESYFSQEITNKIGELKFSDNFPIYRIIEKGGGSYFSCERINPIAFHLLIYSIIWRASISNKPVFKGFEIPEGAEELLRKTLDTFLPEYKHHRIATKLKHWLKEIENNSEHFHIFPYVILRSEDEVVDLEKMTAKEKVDWEKRKTKNLLYFNFEDNDPFQIILNEFIILAFFEESEFDFSRQDLFELSDKYNLNAQLNNKLEPPKIGIISHHDWSNINKKLINILKEQRINNMRRECIRSFILKQIIPTKKDIDDCVEKRKNEIIMDE
ncbi:hypothetical protein ED312_06645 [Sinomicrobium pectinilyticum]|uniref:Uncharacterized protein n=1 Tax=Sinomicrobium pectinilyticum TaxID=1084421 RepID=A0A3N0EQA6_SINP1|nr:hypothetical protein [Sinomicrobium pectinilyticum]RNL90098.1 hypothetical protein ED312_06645 [Sinomicrobium pectinilyticum]